MFGSVHLLKTSLSLLALLCFEPLQVVRMRRHRVSDRTVPIVLDETRTPHLDTFPGLERCFLFAAVEVLVQCNHVGETMK